MSMHPTLDHGRLELSDERKAQVIFELLAEILGTHTAPMGRVGQEKFLKQVAKEIDANFWTVQTVFYGPLLSRLQGVTVEIENKSVIGKNGNLIWNWYYAEICKLGFSFSPHRLQKMFAKNRDKLSIYGVQPGELQEIFLLTIEQMLSQLFDLKSCDIVVNAPVTAKQLISVGPAGATGLFRT